MSLCARGRRGRAAASGDREATRGGSPRSSAASAATQQPAASPRAFEQIARLAGERDLDPNVCIGSGAVGRQGRHPGLDRLRAHVAAANDLVASSQPVGRKFEFLAQEFNREANTICSKAADIETTRTGLELKTVIDQLREQVQNIE
jgi:pyruvate/2-oxoglutarate dehydrogenase complex dihydrolipoamide acyltransferase (E2) component